MAKKISKSSQRPSTEADWPLKLISVSRLQLDPDNPRFGTAMKRPTQRELIADLLHHEEVMDLVRDMAQLGYFQDAVLIAVKEGSRYIVVEGNRRLAALKLLLNPDLAPEGYVKRIKHQIQRGRKRAERIRVVVAPSRAAAVPSIVARHKGKPIQSWTTIMQARFIVSRIREGLGVDEVSQETGIERSEVVKLHRDARLYDVVRSLSLPADVRQVVDDPRRFRFTTLQRFIDTAAVRQSLGMKTDEVEGFVTTLAPEEFQAHLTVIVTDIALEEITSRSHNTAEQVKGYLRDKIHRSDHSRRASTRAQDLIDPSRVDPVPSRKPKKKASKRSAKPADTLVPRGFDVTIESERIQALAGELSRLKMTSFPNAAGVTLRSLLDISVTGYLQRNGHLGTITQRLAVKSRKSADWVPTLRQQLNYILQTASIPLNPEGRKSLQMFISDANQPLTLDRMDQYVHGGFTPPTADQLRSYWTMLTPLFELTLQADEEEVD